MTRIDDLGEGGSYLFYPKRKSPKAPFFPRHFGIAEKAYVSDYLIYLFFIIWRTFGGTPEFSHSKWLDPISLLIHIIPGNSDGSRTCDT